MLRTGHLNYMLAIPAFLIISLIVISIIKTVDLLYQTLFFVTPLSIPFLFSGGFEISLPSEGMLLFMIPIIGLKIITGLKIDVKILLHPISIVLALDVIWSFIASLLSEDIVVSTKRTVLKLIFFIVYVLFLSQYFKKEKQASSLYNLYLVGMVIPILFTLYQHSIMGFTQPTSIYVSKPFYLDHTIYAACLAFLIPFAGLKVFEKGISAQVRFIYIVALIGLLTSVMLSYSRAAWISLIAAAIFLILIKIGLRFWHLLIILCCTTFVFVYNFESTYEQLQENEVKYNDDVSQHIVSVTNLQNDASNLERINRWVCALRMFEEKPIVGFGPGTYQFYYDRYQTPEFMTRISTHNGDKGNAHSEYITLLAENGIIGFLLFTSTILLSLYTALKIIKRTINNKTRLVVLASILGLITFYVHGLFNTFSDFDKMSILVLGSLSILIVMDYKTQAIDQK